MDTPIQERDVRTSPGSLFSGDFEQAAHGYPPRSEDDGRDITEILRREIKLPSPPAVAIRILNAFKNEDVSSEELVRIISSDPALALKVLKLANSALYSRAGKIDTIKKAVSILGTRVLKNIALSFVVVDGMNPETKASADFESFWRKSITAAVSSCVVAQLIGERDDDLFMVALLQDIGEVILRQHDPKVQLELPLDADPRSRIAAEREVFGVDHPALGSLLLNQWGLPSRIGRLVQFHHETDGAPESLSKQLYVLQLANKLAEVFHGQASGHLYEDFTVSLRTIYPANHAEIEQVISTAHAKTQETLAFFEIDAGNMKTCAQILQEANEELGKLNLTYEQLVLELRRAKEEAERYALELKEVNKKLQELAYRDPLTGLFNHGHFQQLLDREIARANRYSRPFSLILFDLDHFKKINDEYGHPVGDEVLKKVSNVAVSNVRHCDYVARYGGEEFAVILPETEAEGALILGDRLRRTIEKNIMKINEFSVSCTISLGVFTYNPKNNILPKTNIISNADKALYFSKKNGRNKLSLYKSQ